MTYSVIDDCVWCEVGTVCFTSAHSTHHCNELRAQLPSSALITELRAHRSVQPPRLLSELRAPTELRAHGVRACGPGLATTKTSLRGTHFLPYPGCSGNRDAKDRGGPPCPPPRVLGTQGGGQGQCKTRRRHRQARQAFPAHTHGARKASAARAVYAAPDQLLQYLFQQGRAQVFAPSQCPVHTANAPSTHNTPRLHTIQCPGT